MLSAAAAAAGTAAAGGGGGAEETSKGDKEDAGPTTEYRWYEIPTTPRCPHIKNHTTTLAQHRLVLFGGYFQHNDNRLYVYNCETRSWESPVVEGVPPSPRNGHTATFLDNSIVIIGGWMGESAADDVFQLVIPKSRATWTWRAINTTGRGPGSCNMHSAVFAEQRRSLLVFRGGDGRNYLNDLHSLNVDTWTWTKEEPTGELPGPRANHDATLCGDKMFVFGGWNGSIRLNDLYALDIPRMSWSRVQCQGLQPAPRAGMTMCCIGPKLFVFGGTRTTGECHEDLYVFDTHTTTWHCAVSDEVKGIDNASDASVSSDIVVTGTWPIGRTGHTATVYKRCIYIIGGVHRGFMNHLAMLDTDPSPETVVKADSPADNIITKLAAQVNDDSVADVCFIVEGRRIYAHRLILCLASDKFSSMFRAGFLESRQLEIPVPSASYSAFFAMVSYIYSSKMPDYPTDAHHFRMLLELLVLADEYFLRRLLEECEVALSGHISDETVQTLMETALSANARQLFARCQHWIAQREYSDDEMASARGAPSWA